MLVRDSDLAVHAFDFLKLSEWAPVGVVVPVFGGERFLSTLVTRHVVEMLTPEGESDEARLVDGDRAVWSDIHDELSTASLFSAAARIVVMRDADGFVKINRDRLEKLAREESRDRCLVLCVTSWAANTRLAKICEQHGDAIAVNSPVRPRGKSRDDKKILEWVGERAEMAHGIQLKAAAAQRMLDLLEDDYGRIDNELAKLALVAPGTAGQVPDKIGPETIDSVVGGWKNQSVWQAVEHAVDGNLGQAWTLLHRLLIGGEHPLSLYGQIAWSLRRYSAAYDYFMRARRQGNPVGTGAALEAAGFRKWGGEIEEGERRMKVLGRRRLAGLHEVLLATDLALKGTHSSEKRGRFALELLFARLAQPQPAPAQSGQPKSASPVTART